MPEKDPQGIELTVPWEVPYNVRGCKDLDFSVGPFPGEGFIDRAGPVEGEGGDGNQGTWADIEESVDKEVPPSPLSEVVELVELMEMFDDHGLSSPLEIGFVGLNPKIPGSGFEAIHSLRVSYFMLKRKSIPY